MRRFLVFIISCLASIPPALSIQTPFGLDIKSPKDALVMVHKDFFGIMSLEDLYKDIVSDTVYQEQIEYSTGFVAVASQNSRGHFGSIEFEFEPPYDFTIEDVVKHGKTLKGVDVNVEQTRVYYSWESFGFTCSVDFDSDEDFPLFHYVCNYQGK